MKRPFLLLLCFAILFLGIAAIFYVWPLLAFTYTSRWKYCADFDTCGEAFVRVKDYLSEVFADADEVSLFISRSEDGSRQLHDRHNNTYPDIPADINEALEKICNQGFPNKDASFDRIRIERNRIAFCVFNGQYALVFSPDEKPTYVNSADEANRVFVKKIGNGWYHVTINPAS